jgi:hypothetical protein
VALVVGTILNLINQGDAFRETPPGRHPAVLLGNDNRVSTQGVADFT